jgi:ATP-dependent helicase/nuclease subunit A
VLRYRETPAKPETLSLFDLAPQQPTKPKAPEWLMRPVASVGVALAPLSPSQLHDETTPIARRSGTARRQAMARGVVMHRLLQSLPAIHPDHRADAARRYLAGKSKDLTAEECEELARKAITLVSHPDFAAAFSPESKAEVPIVGRVLHGGQARDVAGVVDRLVVSGDAILIVDHKTNRDPPRTPDKVPDAYLAQLALYRAVLTELYPGRAVRAALIWTEVPDLMEISGVSMDGALAQLTTA